MRKHIPIIILLFITGLGAILRFYNLDWGGGHFFHPDERNIIYAISRIDFSTNQFNPEFWAYGSFPVYLIYSVNWVLDFILKPNTLVFSYFGLTGRVLSALCSVALIPLSYLLTLKALPRLNLRKQAALLTALIVAFLPGMIQFAHFMTFEIFLTFQYVLLVLLCYRLSQRGGFADYLWVSIIMGLSIGTKITSLVLIPVLLVAHLISIYNQNPTQWIKRIVTPSLILSIVIIGFVSIASSPFHILDWQGFQNSLDYESSVADGSLEVFYTQQFRDTIPGIYQLMYVFPYIFSIPLTLLSLIAVVFLTAQSLSNVIKNIKTQVPIDSKVAILSLLLVATIGYLGFHFTLYVKWTRYMVPVLPFLTVLSIAWLYDVFESKSTHHSQRFILRGILAGAISTWVIFQGLSFWQHYTFEDTRVTAAQWSNNNLPPSSTFASEIYDLGIMPFNIHFPYSQISLLNIYDLDRSENEQIQVQETLEQADYFIVLSQRLWRTRYRLPDTYPHGYELYRSLFEEDGWSTVAQFQKPRIGCNVWTFYCFGGRILPDETFTVFDHPTIVIFEKTP